LRIEVWLDQEAATQQERKINTKRVRIASGLLTGFIALTAIGGGIAMLAGADQFPLAWLQGTPFSDYTIPALVLEVVVGGSSLIAAVTVFRGHKSGARAAMVAGLIMVVFIVVEVLILKQLPPGPTPIEVFYFGLGVVIAGLGAYLQGAAKRHRARTAD
jgi:hypothetical protein